MVPQTLIDLFKEMDNSTTVLTPNRRLSASLHKLFQQYQIDQDKTYWQTPDILPLNTWIQRLWDEYLSQGVHGLPLVLNPIQEQFLWEKILISSKDNASIFQISETANIVKSAWSLLRQWCIDVDRADFQGSEDYMACHHWIKQFDELCNKMHWIAAANLPEKLCDFINQNQLAIPRKIILFGFNELSPQLQQLLSICTEHQTQIIQMNLMQNEEAPKQISLINQDDEILTMARWAKQTLNKHPDVHIGCVIPSLEKKRDHVMQIFFEVFAEENNYNIDLTELPFNISAGKILSQYPIIKTAIQLLSLQKNIVSLETISHLLSSPFLGESESEHIKRAHFDSMLRKNNINTIDLSSRLKSSNATKLSFEKYCPKLTKRWVQYFSYLDQHQEKQNFSAWAKHFNQLLTILGWPGERSLNSVEYQIVENWLNVLNELTSLDHVSKPIKFNVALQTLEKIISKIPFQAKTPDAPIQILGILEAAALPFDYVWVAGMDDVSWPPKPKPNPLLPKRLQRERQMPHATSERELIYCKQMADLFIHSAKHIIFSYSENDDDMELQASPLIRNFEKIKYDDLNLEKYFSPCERIYQSKQTEILSDESGPKVHDNEKIRGGTSVIQQQALCPFKAFAEWRLHARELEAPLPGLRQKDRGTLIHKTIELIWKQLKDHATLVSMNENEMSDLIIQSINEALTILPDSHSNHIQYLSIEKKHLHQLMLKWLELEKTRTPFKVLMSEKSSEITLNQLTLTIRIDRIDELSDGKKLIVDYKTGKHNDINHWLSDRPEEPQLPLYSLLDKKNTVGIAFAQIFPGEHCFKGISQYTLDVKGIKQISEIKKINVGTWSDQLDEWHTILKKLSDNFYFGNAKVQPKKNPETCLWCALKPLCRINEEVSPCKLS